MRLACIAFALNWVWEIVQMAAYKSSEEAMLESLFFCTLATFIDALTILTIYAAAAAFFIDGRGWRFYLTAALLGSVFAVLFEKIAFAFGWWSYNDRMPILPVLGTGLLPLAQLTILAPLSIRLAMKAGGRRY